MDKLRILWIDDCEGYEKNACYPELSLPEQYQPYFQIVRNSSKLPSSAPTTSAFLDIFVPFFLGGKTDDLPAEIVAMDYNLSKYRPPSDTSIDPGDQDPRADVAISSTSSSVPTAKTGEEQSFNFEGLVLGTFYAAMISPHPAGVIPITSYSSLADNPIVRMMHNLYERILKVDFSNFIVSGKTRSWTNVLPLGVQAFRQRVEALHVDGDLQLYFDDLMKIYDGSGDILTIRSKHATRRLPIRGVFIDHNDDSWPAAAKMWASTLIADIVGEGYVPTLKKADRISEELWGGYNNNELFEKRWRLSDLHSRREELSNVEKGQLEELYGFFGVQLGSNPDLGTCTKNTVDFRNYDLDDATRRWASFFVLFRLLQRMVKARKKWQEATARRTNPLNLQNVSVEDWMLALYPIAKDPIILPFPEFNTKDSAKDISNTWGANLYRNRGEYAINPLHVFSGYDWGKELKKGPACGLRQAERRILLEKTLDTAELTEKDWAQCEQAQIIFRGEANDE